MVCHCVDLKQSYGHFYDEKQKYAKIIMVITQRIIDGVSQNLVQQSFLIL